MHLEVSTIDFFRPYRPSNRLSDVPALAKLMRRNLGEMFKYSLRAVYRVDLEKITETHLFKQARIPKTPNAVLLPVGGSFISKENPDQKFSWTITDDGDLDITVERMFEVEFSKSVLVDAFASVQELYRTVVLGEKTDDRDGI